MLHQDDGKGNQAVEGMESKDFQALRKALGATQKQLAELLGISLKAVHSYEQGWRSVPAAVERQLMFLLYLKNKEEQQVKPCWLIKKCPPERKKACPAWTYNAGKFCWFINGTICECKAQTSWRVKMKICKSCEVLAGLLKVLEHE